VTQALLIVGHGTRDPAGQHECDELIDRVRAARPGLRVELGYLELCPPPIADSIERLAADGVTDVTIVPLVLLAAGHAKGDVPAAIARSRTEHPRVRFRYGRALGVHPQVLQVSDERLRDAVDADDRDRTAVALIGRGSSDPDANADLAKIARLLWEGRPWSLVEPGYVSLAEPSVAGVLDRLAALGAERIAVHPYFLFTGVLERRIRDQAAAWAEANPSVQVLHAGHLGPHDRIAQLLLARHDEAVAGDVRANCDTCQYRTALPGFEHRVGEPQTLHYHPDDEHTHRHAHHPDQGSVAATSVDAR
jgi:sirohydrochlorin cobaltochelatase